MESTKRALKFFLIPIIISIASIGVVSILLLVSGTWALSTLGNILLYLGIGVIVVGFALINFRRTTVDIHMRHQGAEEHQRRKAQTDVAEYHIGFAIVLAGLILAATGWFMLHIAVCGRINCG